MATNAADRRKNKDKADAQAWAAVQEFQKMKPSLTRFARAMTGNPKVQVVGTHQVSSTDGRALINVSIPVGLGDKTSHNRTYCNKRGGNGRQLCLACDIRELTLRNLYHEIGHIVGNSIVAPSGEMRRMAAKMVMEFHANCAHTSGKLSEIGMSDNYVRMAKAINEFMFIIWDSIEDARTDSRMMAARPGLKGIFKAGVHAALERGILNPNTKEYVPLSTAPANAQAIMYAYLGATGYADPVEYLSTEVLDKLDNAALNKLLEGAVHVSNAHETFDIALKVFAKLYELGFVQVKRCNPQPEPQDKPDEDIPSLDKEHDENGSPDSKHGGDADNSPDDQQQQPGPDAGTPDADERAESGGSPGAGQPGSSQSAGESGDPAPSDSGDPTQGDGEQSDESPGSGGGGEQDGPEDSERGQGAVPDDAEGEGADGRGGEGQTEPGDLDHDEPGDPEAGGDEGGDHSGDGAGDDDKSGSSDDLGRDDSDGESGDEGDADASNEPGHRDGESESVDQEAGSSHAGDPGSSGGRGDGNPEDSDEHHEDEGQREDRGETPGSLEEEAGEGSDFSDGPEPSDSSVWDGDNPIATPSSPVDDGGAASSAGEIFRELTGHGGQGEADSQDQELEYALSQGDGPTVGTAPDSDLIEKAVSQVSSFDTRSKDVMGIKIIEYPLKAAQWDTRSSSGDRTNLLPESKIIGEALMEARLTFSANQRTGHEKNLRSGKINGPALGRRAPLGDDRMFHKRIIPSKRSYAVVIGVDVSGSTISGNRIERIKRAVFAQAELLSRLGVDFAIYAHTSGPDISKAGYIGGWDWSKEYVWELEVKSFSQPWNAQQQEKLSTLVPMFNNFDGHSLEFYRKLVEKQQSATDKVILYYTDGEMPAANYEEELEVLQREILYCNRRKISLMAVGINTDSPEKYGFDTVKVDSDADLKKVVSQLKRKLTR